MPAGVSGFILFHFLRLAENFTMANGHYFTFAARQIFHYSHTHMVDVAQLVSASDCGSEGRGFDSHHPPHKNRRYLRISPVFIWYSADDGSRKGEKKTVRWTVFRPWETPLDCGRIRQGCGRSSKKICIQGGSPSALQRRFLPLSEEH